VEIQFCSILYINGKLYVIDQVKVGGPRAIRLPLHECDEPFEAFSIGRRVLKSLDRFEPDGRRMTPDDWDRLNDELLLALGEKSISSFERKKNEVTVRRTPENGVITLFDKGDETLELRKYDESLLGGSLLQMLKLQ